MERHDFGQAEARTANKGFAIAGVPCFEDTFVQGGSSVLRMKFSAKNPAFAKRPNVMPNAMTTTDKIKNKTAKALPSFSYILAYEIDKIKKYL